MQKIIKSLLFTFLLTLGSTQLNAWGWGSSNTNNSCPLGSHDYNTYYHLVQRLGQPFTVIEAKYVNTDAVNNQTVHTIFDLLTDSRFQNIVQKHADKGILLIPDDMNTGFNYDGTTYDPKPGKQKYLILKLEFNTGKITNLFIYDKPADRKCWQFFLDQLNQHKKEKFFATKPDPSTKGLIVSERVMNFAKFIKNNNTNPFYIYHCHVDGVDKRADAEYFSLHGKLHMPDWKQAFGIKYKYVDPSSKKIKDDWCVLGWGQDDMAYIKKELIDGQYGRYITAQNRNQINLTGRASPARSYIEILKKYNTSAEVKERTQNVSDRFRADKYYSLDDFKANDIPGGTRIRISILPQAIEPGNKSISMWLDY